MRPDVAVIVRMMNQHCRAARRLVVIEVKRLQFRKGVEAEGDGASRHYVIEYEAAGVKDGGIDQEGDGRRGQS